MMKSFFKKLASVLALAMVVSLAAPAAQTAQAAEAKEFTYKHTPSYSSTVKTVNLAKTGDVADLRFVGIPDYTKYELKWMAVGTGFTVDQSGVITATADEGEGVVWLSVGDDQTYVSDPVKVTIGELKATIGCPDMDIRDFGTEGLELKVGKTADLAFYGITDWNLGKYGYKWVVGDSSVLDVDQKTGEITALKAGTTTVTFMAPNRLNTTNVVITAPLTVTVKPSEITFEVTNNGYNTTQNEVIVEFSEKYAPKNVELFRVFVADDSYNFDGRVDENLHEDAYESIYVNNAYAIDDTNQFSINPYVEFVDGAIYEIRIDGLKKVWFKASVGPVAKVVVKEDFKGSLVEDIEEAIPSEFSVDLYDKNNVKVDGAKVNGIANESPEYITFSLVEDGAFDLDVDELTFYDYVAARVVATYESSAVDAPVVSAEFKAMPHKKSVYGVEKILAWTVALPWQNNIDWDNTNQWIASGDEDRQLAVLFQDTRNEYYTTDERGSGWKKYNGKDIYVNYTGKDETMINGEGTTFAKYGYYVEFKAMDGDNLLIDVDGTIRSFLKTRSRWGLYLYNYNNQEDQFVKEIFSAILKVEAEREMDDIKATFNEKNLMYFTEEEAGVANAYYSDFSRVILHLDCFDQYDWSWNGEAKFEITSVTKNIAAFEELLDKYEETLNESVAHSDMWGNNDGNDNGNKDIVSRALRDASLEIELVDFLEVDPAVGADGYGYRLFDNKPSFSFIIKEVNSGDTEKITINFKTPTDYLIATDEDVASGLAAKKGDKIYQGFAVVLDGKLTDSIPEERFDLSTNNSVSVSYATEIQWKNSIKTNENADKSIVVQHEDSKGYQIGYENDLLLGTKIPSYNGGLKRYTLSVTDLFDKNNLAITDLDDEKDDRNPILGTKVLIVTKPNGKALNLQVNGDENAALTSLEKRIYANQTDLLAPATGASLGVKIGTNTDPYTKNYLTGAKDDTPSYNFFNLNFMHTVDYGTEKEITFLPAGNYKANVYTIEGFLYGKYQDPTDNKWYYTGDDDKDNVLDATETWTITDVIFSGNSQFKQTTTFKVTNNLPQITFAKRLNATTTDDLASIDANEHDEYHVKELIAENFQFKLDGLPYNHHNLNDGKQITADDIVAYNVSVSSNGQLNVHQVTLKVYVDWNNNGDIGRDDGENVWYRSTCTVNQSLTYKEEN